MKTKFLLIPAISFSVFFTSCLPKLSVTAGKSDEAVIQFSTGFSKATAKTLQSVTGADENAPLFSKDDILAVLNSAGAVETSANIPSSTEINAKGRLPELSKHPLSQTGLIKKTDHSITLTLGPKQITEFYEILSENAKSYLDLMMIPALIGEEMSVQEYKELLSSMYGPTFAEEIVSGKLTINLSSPDGKKKLEQTLSLGEILSAKEEQSWSITF